MIKFIEKESKESTIREQYDMNESAYILYKIKFWEYYAHSQPTQDMTRTDVAKRRTIEYLKSVHMIR